jgi:hypothetical protein
VGCPAGVSDAEGSLEGVLAQDFLEVGELAWGAANFKRGAGRTADGDAGRIVATVFETPQPLDDDRNDFLFANVPDNSAHVVILCDMRAHGCSPKVEAGLCFRAGERGGWTGRGNSRHCSGGWRCPIA